MARPPAAGAAHPLGGSEGFVELDTDDHGGAGGAPARDGAAPRGGASGAGGTALPYFHFAPGASRSERKRGNVARAAEARHAASLDNTGPHQGFVVSRRRATVAMADEALYAASRARAVQPPPLFPGSEQRKAHKALANRSGLSWALRFAQCAQQQKPMSYHPGTANGQLTKHLPKAAEAR